MRPRKGNGDRFLDCRYYDECLDLAGIENWKGFNCEACDFYLIVTKGPDALIEAKPMSQNMNPTEDRKVCQDCGERPPISKKSPYCARCMAKRANEAKKAKKAKKKPLPKHPKKVSPSKAKAEKSPPHGDEAVVTIDFGKYAPILRKVESLAEEEVRSVESQIIYILKICLSSSAE